MSSRYHNQEQRPLGWLDAENLLYDCRNLLCLYFELLRTSRNGIHFDKGRYRLHRLRGTMFYSIPLGSVCRRILSRCTVSLELIGS